MRGLLVDDSTTDRLLGREMMRTCRPDWHIDEAWEADQVTAMLRDGPPDFILLDVNMAPDDGFAILQRIRDDPDGATVPVFMHSTSGFQSHRDMAERLGADGYLPKPVSLSEYEHICEILEKSAGP